MDKRRFFLGNVPEGEDPISMEGIDYFENCEQACKDFIRLIRKKLGREPEGSKLKLSRDFDDDSGQETIQVVYVYDEEDDSCLDFLEVLEHNPPKTWDDDSKED
ncbi:MAG: hypothetical protein HC875_39025 [Anaerolineales bacterium]|nr:hypothetical protein [Anaerolineales bacterium]